MDNLEVGDKQRYLQRILDRVQELPVLPGNALEMRPAPAALATPTTHARATAARFWLLALTSATATIVVGVVACVVTLNLMQQRPSERVEQVSLNHAHVKDAPIVAPPAGNLSPPDEPAQEKAAPAATPAAETADRSYIERTPPTPEAATPHAEPGNAQDFAPPEARPPLAKPVPRDPSAEQAEPKDPATDTRKPPPERRRAVRAAVAQPEQTQVIEPNGRSRTVGVADVLSGGL